MKKIEKSILIRFYNTEEDRKIYDYISNEKNSWTGLALLNKYCSIH